MTLSSVALAAEAAEGTPLGDTALLSQLLRGRKDARHHRMFDGVDFEAARRLLARLDRAACDPAQPDGADPKTTSENGRPAAEAGL